MGMSEDKTSFIGNIGSMGGVGLRIGNYFSLKVLAFQVSVI